jgi:predicted ribosome quality control (RQC) complex YloA/Tae2 family protein
MKSKVRFDGLDVSAMVAHWNREALGRRVINIYDGPNGDSYLFKLDKPSGEDSNLLLFMESGLRFHSTQQPFENPGMPSQFCSKLRKHLRGLRLENVQQLGNKDRVVNLVFGSGETQRHSLILELYARGNIILADSQYQILSLLRSHEYDNVMVKVGHAYPVTYATTMTLMSEDGTPGDDQASQEETLLHASNPMQWFQNYQKTISENKAKEGKGRKKKGGESNVWRNLLLKQQSGVSHYGPSLIDHCLLCAEFQKLGMNPKLPGDVKEDDWKRLQSVLQETGSEILNKLDVADSKGYIFYKLKEKKLSNGEEQNSNLPPSPFDDKLLMEFQPHLLKQHESLLKLEYESFDRAVDTFFSHIEGQKRMMGAERQQAQAQLRLEKIRQDQKQRVMNLERQQDILKEQAQLVEVHAETVENAIQVVNSALDSGMDWDQLEDLIQIEKYQNKNPVAMLIHKLDLEQDNLVLRLLRETVMNKDDENEEELNMDITVSLKDTAHGNARALFAKYRASKEKSQKTLEASSKALQAAEESAKRQLMDAQKRKKHLSHNMNVKRKPLWFEKFNWFITSDNYLVLGGRDAQQNEQIVKRYLRPGDAYLHADVHGAASCVLRAKRRRQADGKTMVLPLPDQALREAGNFTICRSSAWSSRMVTSAWWVESHQVSKTAPTGEYLTVGSFMIRGKKNFLPPTQLEMGLGVLYRLGDDEAIARHKNERRDFALMQMEEKDEINNVLPPEKRKAISKSKYLLVVEEEKKTYFGEDNTKVNVPPKDESTLERDILEPADTPYSEDIEEASAEQTITSEAEASVTKEEPKPKTKKGLSVKERKLIKKYGSLEKARAAEEERLKVEEEGKKVRAATFKPKNNNPPQAGHKRGKKAKLKKMAKKYADQDDEDRELAMMALHAGEKVRKEYRKKSVEISEIEMEAAADTVAILKKDSSTVAAKFPDEVRDILAKCVIVKTVGLEDKSLVRWDKFDADVLEQLQAFDVLDEMLAAATRLLNLKESTRIDNFSASLAGIIRTIKKYGHKGLGKDEADATDESKRKTKAEKEAETKSWKETLAKEGIVEVESEEDALDDTVELGKLSGKPHNDDLILFAVPVCAPYQTLSQYTYRVKLTPGNMKRGKASKQCIEMFLRDGQKSTLTDRNKDFIRKVADNEWVSAICGDVKISAAGASKAMKNQKSRRKNNAKNRKK